MQKIVDLPLSDIVYRRIRSALISGTFSPGEKLVIDKVSADLGVSQTPVREAIKRLVAIAALEYRPNHSVVVPTMSRETYSEIAEIRCRLEGLAAENAASKAPRKAIETFVKLQEEMDAARDAKEYRSVLDLNQAFHFQIIKTAEMPVLLEIVETIWTRSGPLMALIEGRGVYAKSTPKHPHWRLIAAFKAGDPDAARDAIVEDIRGGAEIILNMLEQREADAK